MRPSNTPSMGYNIGTPPPSSFDGLDDTVAGLASVGVLEGVVAEVVVSSDVGVVVEGVAVVDSAVVVVRVSRVVVEVSGVSVEEDESARGTIPFSS